MYKVCCGVAKIYEGLCTLFSSLIICVVFPSLKTKVIMVKDHEDWNTTTQHHIFIIVNEGDIGGTPNSLNTVRKIDKYQNTVLTINEIPIPHLRSVMLT